MNAHQLIDYMDFMMNLKEDTVLLYGRNSQIVLIVYLLRQ